MSIVQATGTVTVSGGASKSTAAVTLSASNTSVTSTTITFTDGVAQRISVASLLPPADRYTGGYYYDFDIYSQDFFKNIWFDAQTKEMVYDGTPMSNNPSLITNPSSKYWLGYESAPYSSHWANPTDHTYPADIAGVKQSIPVQSKHVRARWCPYDNRVWFFGGDYNTGGIYLDPSEESGRMTFWRLDPATGIWDLGYPAHGRVGEEQPLSPDVYGFVWDQGRQIWWIAPGNVRPGFDRNSLADIGSPTKICWKQDGGLSDAYPPSGASTYPNLGLDWPVWTFDPKVAQPKFTRLANVPWNADHIEQYRHCVYDETSKRLYTLGERGSGIRVRWLDTTLYETNPAAMAWDLEDLDLSLGAPKNLTGVRHDSPYGAVSAPTHVDVANRRILWIDMAKRHLLELTLPGNPTGTHYVKLVSDFSAHFQNITGWVFGTLGFESMPSIWIPEHRSVVIMVEPLKQNVGPYSCSITIDVDTGIITPGPRFPDRPTGKAWFPDAGCWMSGPGQILLFGLYLDNDWYGAPNNAVWGRPSGYHKVAWVP